jgi:hypothetical protein
MVCVFKRTFGLYVENGQTATSLKLKKNVDTQTPVLACCSFVLLLEFVTVRSSGEISNHGTKRISAGGAIDLP